MNWYESRHDDYRSPIVKGMGRYKAAEHKRERTLADDEIRALWPVCEAAGTFGAIVRFGLLTAQRRDKLASIRWADIEDGTWTIRREPREKANAGSLRLSPMALEIIEAQPRLDGNPYIFAGRGHVAFNGWSKAKAALDAKLPGIEPWTVHDLRRTARSLMSRAGVKPHVAERVLGHAIAGVEGVYDRHGYDEEKALALDALAGLIARILNPTDNVVSLAR
jgi:integrase